MRLISIVFFVLLSILLPTAQAQCSLTCPSGSYFASCDVGCVPCPKGYYCPSAVSAPIACPPGTYSNTASAVSVATCSNCAAGSISSAEASTSCTACPEFNIVVSGRTACSACPAGTWPETNRLSCTALCGAGWYGERLVGSNSGSCKQCSAGYICPSRTTGTEFACQPGNYSDAGSVTCSRCPAGRACPGSTGLAGATVCAVGQYSALGSSSCVLCPANMFCTAVDVVPSITTNKCSPGSYSMEGEAVCTLCPAGSYCDGTSASGAPILCPAGRFSLAGKAVCDECPAGYSCSASSAPALCALGTYSPLGTTSCLPCPAGSACSLTDAVLCAPGTASSGSASVCTPCVDGYYATSSGSSQCTPCPAEYYCPSKVDPPIQCQKGYTSPGASLSCVACPLGSAWNRRCLPCPQGHFCSVVGMDPVPCPPGSYSGVNQTSCSLCPPGYYCPAATAIPLACVVGTYSSGGLGECLKCPVDYSCTTTGNLTQCNVAQGFYSPLGDAACHLCPAGRVCLTAAGANTSEVCAPGTYRIAGTASCVICPPGYMCPYPQYGPMRCPKGAYSGVGALTCSICPVGFACNNRTQPVACLLGTYSSGGDEVCTDCPAGFMCPSPLNSPTPCPRGTFSIGGAHNCTICPRGYACPHVGYPEVNICPLGTYSIGSQAECTVCPAGFYCPSTEFAIEIPCATGSYSLNGQSSCTICPASYECPRPNGVVYPPRKCLSGSFSIGGSTQCTICPAGYACPNDNLETMVPCVNGTFSEPGQRACSDCAAGFYCPLTAVSSTQPFIGVLGVGRQVACPPGTFSSGNQQECTRCPQGFYCTSTTGNGAATPCGIGKLTTRLGQYVNTGATECSDCPSGFACSVQGESASTCEPGTYSLNSACVTCPAGFECPSTSREPIPCPAGTYSPGGFTSCRPCRAGYICEFQSTTDSPVSGICPVGHYCPAGSTTATMCPAGTFGGLPGKGDLSACEACAAGKTCSAGATVQVDCPPGSYCPVGSPFPTPCPAGTYSTATAAQSRATCVLCPEQFFCPSGSSDFTANPCPPGYYCPAGSGSGFENGCPIGTYSPEGKLASATQCFVCPSGHYCPSAGMDAASPCPPGTYQPNSASASCLPCEEGWACEGVKQKSSFVTPCGQGHYCPRGSANRWANPCPAGSYTFRTNLASHTQCEACWRGYACPAGTGAPGVQPTICPAGFYCPGAPKSSTGERTLISEYQFTVTVHERQFMCPQGTYSPATGLWDAAQCLPCTVGRWCPGGGSNDNERCAAGYYCPMGSFKSTQIPCEAGTYGASTGLESQSQCRECVSGYYCPQAATSPIQCPAGTYSPFNRTVDRGPSINVAERQCLQCPAGYYCPLGSSRALPCPAGSYSGPQAWMCTACESGRYCPQVATTRAKKDTVFQCPAGLFCEPGMDHMPNIESNPCPAGSYCPLGAVAPVKCFPGTYNRFVGKPSIMDCVECEAGYYCAQEGATNVTGECAPGHYCPIGSSSAFQEPCPARYYRSSPRGETAEFCSVCLRGYYCPEGCATPVVCPQGYYCLDGSDIPEPCPIGTFGNRTGLRARSECSSCTSGYYCDGLGLSHPTGLCDPGYYCIGRAFSSAPPGLPTGGLCPKGGYCPPGSSLPTACAEGTFNNNTGGSTQQDCVTCTPGYYCAGSNLPFPTGPCAPGYYCTGGASKPTQFRTPAGYYSLAGAAAPSECALGTYNPLPGQGACTACVIGNYCPTRALVNYIICPPGGYCPAASVTPRACPAGTFQPYTNRQNITNCIPCSPGHYCQSDNLTAPTAECSAGFYCKRWCITTTCGRYLMNYIAVENAMANTGVENNIGGSCPYGKICAGGTSYPQLCPVGTVRDAIQGAKEEDCNACPPRYYCPNAGMSSFISSNKPMLCDAGFYCPGAIAPGLNVGCSDPTCSNHTGEDCTLHYIGCSGTNSFLKDPGSRRCPRGYYCLAGSDQPRLCFLTSWGKTTFQNELGQATCKMCPEGFWCDPNILSSVQEPQPCPVGRYCPKGTSSNQPRCPEGTWSNVLQLVNFSQCAQCPPTRYCPTRGIFEINDAETPQCSAGYYCTAGARNTFGVAGTLGGIGGICPPGHYCPNATATNVSFPCPPGTFKSAWFGTSVRACVACTGGFFCEGTANVKTTGMCKDGFYCPTACADAECMNLGCQSSQLGFPGGACPIGHFCKGTATAGPVLPKQCPEGTYQNETAQSECKDCPPGFYCGVGEIEPQPCGQGRYCPLRTKASEVPRCPPGTYSNYSFAEDLSECNLCPSGFYCPDFGMSEATLLCAAGYFCTNGSMSSSGVVGQRGGLTGVCPRGHFCPQGTGYANEFPCPIGTLLPFTGARNSSMCVVCPPGMHCNTTGLGAVTGPCDPGYYCPRGCEDRFCSNVLCGGSVPGGACPEGSYCPQRTVGARLEGAYQPTLCPAGTFAPTTAHAVCVPCLEGHWCPMGSITPLPCPAGYYCPLGTRLEHEFPCEPGTYQPFTNATREDDCLLCSPGMYCEASGSAEPTGECFGGVYCTSGATTPFAMVGGRGGVTGICPMGFYCPNGTRFSNEFPCPAGTYQPYQGTADSLSCLSCTPGFFCPNISQHAAVDKCTPGYYCPRACNDSTCSNQQCNASTCSTTDIKGGACPVGHICPQDDARGAIFPTACPAGSYAPDIASVVCLPCPSGFFCPEATSVPESCPLGRFCPQNTTLTVPSCPPGTYNDQNNASAVTDCSLCPAGKYCPNHGNSSFFDECFAGYYCISGAVNGRGDVGVMGGIGGICPAGYYCPPGTEHPRQFACPAGSFNPRTGSSIIDDCIPCTAGFYCLGTGMKNVTGRCSAGHFCPIGCIDSNCLTQLSSPSVSVVGGPCPTGHYCPLVNTALPTMTVIHGNTLVRGSSSPVVCQMGYYAPSVGSEQCILCPEGHYCVPGEADARLCVAGAYCPQGTGSTPPLCPPGSFSNLVGLNSSSQCTKCLGGRECPSFGMTSPGGLCARGYYCLGGALNPYGNVGDLGGLISGFPSDALGRTVCPIGHYCPMGSVTPLRCPAGTYNPLVGGWNVSQSCMLCDGGRYCAVPGLSSANGTCMGGYFCPRGCIDARCFSRVAQGLTGGICPVGYYCPPGSAAPIACPPGKTTSSQGATICPACPASYYCPGGGVEFPCPAGKYCPEGTTADIPSCPNGTFSNLTMAASEAACQLCLPSMACTRNGLTAPDAACVAGHFCQTGASTVFGAVGSLGGVGGVCPAGHFCPNATATPNPCPISTFLSTQGALTESECLLCTAGSYCGSAGLTHVEGSCLAGFFCPEGQNTSTPSDYVCPPGHFCPLGSVSPIQCPAGTFNTKSQQVSVSNCTMCPQGKYCDAGEANEGTALCPAGWYCSGGTNSSNPVSRGGFCTSGHICPLGSVSMLPCPPGSACVGDFLAEPTDPCSAGYYCSLMASTPEPVDGITGNFCPQGHYCPLNSSAPQACPSGTYNSVTHQSTSMSCIPCRPGFYCPSAATIAPVALCSVGYYCPLGQLVGEPGAYLCPAGFFCPAGSPAPRRCPIGTFQDEEGMGYCKTCPPGYFCNPKNLCPGTNVSTPQICPSGYYCPNGTRFAEEFPCPPGTYNPSEGAVALANCLPCDAGRHCPVSHMSEAGPNCTAGYICLEGSSVSSPVDGVYGYLCPAGYFCPSGSTIPVACPSGTYSNATRLTAEDECTICTQGSYCLASALTSPTDECAAGYYCPPGQTVAEPSQFQCPYGHVCPRGSSTWLFVPSGHFVDSVGGSVYKLCPAGSFCDALMPCDECPVSPCFGNYTCPRTCPPGYYCLAGTTFDAQYPCPAGTYGGSAGLTMASQCTRCDGGFFCPYPGMSRSSMIRCQAGYICLTGSTVAQPSDNVMGYRCPAGNYCPSAALAPIPCPQGTFNPSMGTTNKSACVRCPVGRACTKPGLSAPDAICEAGYYCPGGLNSANDPHYLCPQGYYCPQGVANPILCEIGKWSSTKGRATCDLCPAGFYCNSKDPCPGSNVTHPRLCFAGHYCPEGTEFGDQFPCPIGTFSTRLGVVHPSECALCPPGFACPSPGMFEPLPQCLSGHYCRLGAIVINPTDGNKTGDVCPSGYYCPTQTGSPFGCPIGTFSSSVGLVNSSQCANCTPGFYCGTVGLSHPSGPCSGGYYCGSGETMSTPSDKLCHSGKYCPEGSTTPLNCPNGTYVPVDNLGRDACLLCPAGYYCNLVQQLADDGPNATVDFVVPQRCPPGYYCPKGTKYKNEHPCPPGTFNDLETLQSVGECKPCTPGMYCALPGQTQPAGRCLPGYVCVLGSNTSSPLQPAVPATMGGICPTGHYCPMGSISGIACPIGTFYGGVGARNVSACSKCRPGYYCPNQATTTPTGAGQCMEGFYCPGGDSSASPPSFICPMGHYCPTGSAAPIPCPGGSHSPRLGLSVCLGCPEYYFCPKGTITPILCFSRHVCAANTSYPDICRNGTYAQNSAAMRSQTECVLCPAGVYCSNGTISGPCAAGYLCEYGNWVPSPSSSTDVLNVKKGGLCPLGHYCPMGTTVKRPCTNQTVGYTLGLQAPTDCSPCRAGYYCLETSVIPIDCPPGYYCPGYVGKSIGLIPCPIGTYNPKHFATDISYCLPCQAGYYCPLEAMASSAVYPSPVGFYSSTGQVKPYPCPGGTYQPNSNGTAAGPAACLTCPVGHYCGPQASTWNHTCPEGTYCPPGSTYPLHCPGASYCPRNTYKPVDCPPGYYCPPRSPVPLLCWNGTFCPPRTEVPFMCPNGYISRNDTTARWEMEDSCQICPPGTFSTNTLYCEPCTAGYVCLGGTTVARPLDIATERGYICPIGYYCPSGSSSPSPCPPGTYNNGTGGRTINACADCQPNFYQPDFAQSTCIRCGKSATSSPGSAGCDCYGRFRSFQPGDGSCRCIPGYVFYTEGQRLSEDDSSLSCQPKIYPRCQPNTYRSSNGDCVQADSASICSFCPNGLGSVDPQIGVCRCEVIQTYEETCDEACIKESNTITMDITSNSLIHYDPKSGSTRSIGLDSSGVLGTRRCAAGATSCDVKMMRVAESGIYGIFNPSFDTIEAGTTAPQNASSQGMRRHMFQSSIMPDERPIASPIVCLGFGDAMIWDVSHPSRQHFPVYVKDSLLNTNPDFDYTEFRDLSEKIASPNFTLTTFIYTFSKPGVYTFADNADIFRITIIRVVSENEICPLSPYEPYTQSSLVSMGVVRDRDLLLAPDWALIGALIGALVVLVLGTIFALWLFRRQRWGIIGTALPRYREHGIASLRDREFANLASKGSTTKRHQLTSSGEERIQAPPESSRPITMRMDVHISEFDVDYFCSTIAEEAGVEENNVLVLSTTDEGKVMVRFVFTGIDEPNRAADDLMSRIMAEGDAQSELHANLNILGFEDSEGGGQFAEGMQMGMGQTNLNIVEMEDEFWDYERQIDLEGFNIRTLYSRLEDQTIHVVSQLAHQRDDLMLLCDKILVESEALKDMFLRIKVDMDDKNDQIRRINDIREEKIISGQVEYDLPEDVKQVLGQFLESFFEKNLPSIIQNANIETTHVENRTVNVIHQAAHEYEIVVHEAQEDGTVTTRIEKGRDAYDAAKRKPTKTTIMDEAKDIDGFKDMFSATIGVQKDSRLKKKRASNAPLSPQELKERESRVRKVQKELALPRDIQDDSDCDETERMERAAAREALLQQRAQRYRRAIDRITMPSGFNIATAIEGVMNETEVTEMGELKRQWQLTRRQERMAADEIPDELKDDVNLPAEERFARRLERERVMAKRVARMEDVLRFFEIPETLEDRPGATPEERAALRVKRDRFVNQKLEKARRIRAELSVPMDLDDDSDAEIEERTRRQDAREEIVNNILAKNPYISYLPDPATAESAGHAANRWQALNTVNEMKVNAASDAIAAREVSSGLSDHSDLDDAERMRRRKLRGAPVGTRAEKKSKVSQRQPKCAPVQLDEFKAADISTQPHQYDDDSDLEDSDRIHRKTLRDAFKAGQASVAPMGVIPSELVAELLSTQKSEENMTSAEKAQMVAIKEAFARGQNSRDGAALLRESLAKSKEVGKEVQELVEGTDEDAKKMFEEGRRAERDLAAPEFSGTEAERRKLTVAYHAGRLTQRLTAVPEEMDEERHNVTAERKKIMKVRAEAFLEGASDEHVAEVPDSFADKQGGSESERNARARNREAYLMGRARAAGEAVVAEIEAMSSIDKDLAKAMQSAVEAGKNAAVHGISEMPAEYRDDVPLLSEGEAARRRHLQAVYLQALKAQQAEVGISELAENSTLSVSERKAARAAFELGATNQRAKSKLPSHLEENPEALAAFIQGAHQRRAAEMIRQDVLEGNSGIDAKLQAALLKGKQTQQSADSVPNELADTAELSAHERQERAARREAFRVGRKARQAQILPTELPEESQQPSGSGVSADQAGSRVSTKSLESKRGARAAQDSASPTEMLESPEDVEKLKQHKQVILKQAREKQKLAVAVLAEEHEAKTSEEVEAMLSVVEKQFRHEINALQLRHGMALSTCPPEEIEALRTKQAGEMAALVKSQEEALRKTEADVRANAEETRTKMEELIASKHLNDARIEASLAEQRAKAARKMGAVYASKKPSEIESVEELMEYKKSLETDLQIRERLQKAKETKEKALLEEQILQFEKIENDNLESRITKAKLRAIERAKSLFENAPAEELAEEVDRVEKTYALELDAQKAALQTRLAAERIAKRKELADRHATVRASEMKESQEAVEQLIEARGRLKARVVKAEEELTDDQKKAVEMMMAQQKIKEEMAQQRRVAAEDAEDEEQRAKADANAKREAAREIARREKENGEKLTDAQRQAILDEFRANAAKLDAASNDEQQRQSDALKRRLEMQRQKKERESNRKNLEAMNVETQRQLEEQLKKAAALAEKVELNTSPAADAMPAAEEASKLDAELAAKSEALKKQHEDQKQQLERQLEEELRKHQDQVTAKLATEAEKRKQALEEEHRKQMAQDLTDDQRKELMEAHEADAQRVEERLAAEAAAQQAKLQARLEAHRRKKLTELADRQRAQNADQDDAGLAAKVELERAAAAATEQQRVQEAIRKGLSPRQAAEVVLSDRHQREIRVMMEHHAKKRQLFEEEKASHQELLEKNKEALAVAVNADIQAIPEEHPDRQRKVEELNKKLQKSLMKLAEESHEQDEAREDALGVQIAEELLAMKMRQTDEVFRAAGIKNTDAIARYKAKLSQAAGAPDEDDELAAFRKQREEQNAAAAEKLRKEQEEQNAAMRAEYEELKRKQDEDFKKQKEAIEEQARLDEERLRQKLAAHKAALAKEGNANPAAAEELENLSKNIAAAHAQTVAMTEEMLRQNEQTQRDEMAARLEMRRRAKKAAAAPTGAGPSKAAPSAPAVSQTTIVESVRKLAQVAQPALAAGTQQPMASAAGDTIHNVENVTNVSNFIINQGGAAAQPQPQQAMMTAGASQPQQQQQIVLGMPAPGSAEYQQWILGVVHQLCASPLMQRLERIERMVEATHKQSGMLSYFLDEKDRAFAANEGRLETVDVARLPAAQYVVYGFALWVLESIQKMNLDIPDVKIAVASSLPDVQSNAIAFRNSYHFDATRKTLYIRDSRLSSIGEFTVVMLHALAHIKAAAVPERGGIITWNDSDPSFLTQFYGLLEVCTEEMFFMRLPKELAARDDASRGFRPSNIMSAKSLATIAESLKSAGETLDGRQAMLKNSLMLE